MSAGYTSMRARIKKKDQGAYRPIRLTQCFTQFKSPGVKILCVLYLHYNVAFSFKCMEIPETKSFIPKGFELGTTLS